MQVKSASFSTDNGQKSRFSFSYRISNNKNFILKYLENALKVLLKLHEHRGDRIGETSSCERFCKVPVQRIMELFRCYDNSDVIATLMMTNFHLNTTVVALFPNVCLWRRSLCSDLVLTLKNRIEPPSFARTAYVVAIWPSFLFDSFIKIWPTCEIFLGKWFTAPPGKKFPVRLCTVPI